MAELEAEVTKADEDIKAERKKVQASANEIGGVNVSNGFVRFIDRIDAEMAITSTYSSDVGEFIVTNPPPAQSIIWASLQAGGKEKDVRLVLGYLLVFALYALYLPLVIWIG